MAARPNFPCSPSLKFSSGADPVIDELQQMLLDYRVQMSKRTKENETM